MPATLRAVGGTAGVGVTFLEETFSAAAAPPAHRLHQKAARAVADPLLRAEVEAPANEGRLLRAWLALLPVDDTRAEPVAERLLAAGPDDLLVLRQPLGPHAGRLTQRLWSILEDTKADPNRRFRAACALAAYDPASARWDAVRAQVARWLVAENSWVLGKWAEALRPVSARLVPVLAERVPEAGAVTFPALVTVLRVYANQALPPLAEQLARKPAADWPDSRREALAKGQARIAVALAQLGRGEHIWLHLRHNPKPDLRSSLLHKFAPLGTDARVLAQRLEETPDASERQALILALGEYTADALPDDLREHLIARLLAWYRTDPDPGVHSAIDWLFRPSDDGDVPGPTDWKQAAALGRLDRELATSSPSGGRQPPEPRNRPLQVSASPTWYVNRQGQTLAVLSAPGVVEIGSPPTEPNRTANEGQHRRRIARSFAIATKLVTNEQYQRAKLGGGLAGSPDLPVAGVSWYQAAAYCNWLSKQEGLAPKEWCYEPNKEGKYEAGMRPAPDFLKRAGYRLPTEAEWEYACRAGTVTSRCYGSAEEILDRYTWYAGNSRFHAWPPGQKKPNDFGLFDVHGNLWQWCQDVFRPYPSRGATMEDNEDSNSTDQETGRVCRGGSFSHQPPVVRSAFRCPNPPDYFLTYVVLRPARTIR